MNSLAPDSMRTPFPVLVTETLIPVRIEVMFSVGMTDETGVLPPGTLIPSMAKVFAPDVMMMRESEIVEMMRGLFEVAVMGVAPVRLRMLFAPTST